MPQRTWGHPGAHKTQARAPFFKAEAGWGLTPGWSPGHSPRTTRSVQNMELGWSSALSNAAAPSKTQK